MKFKFFESFFAIGKTKFASAAVVSTLFLGLLAYAGMTGCKKDNSLKPQQTEADSNAEPSSSITFRDGGVTPTVSNGMLTFPTFNDAKAFAKSLETKETDQAQVNSAYAQLGIDVTGQSIPNLTDYPVCLVTEQALGYTSARKVAETAINSLLNQGDDNVISIVDDPYWNTVLNADKAVRMGNRIYKYYENGGIAIVLNNDWALYNTIKTLSFDELTATYNLIITSDTQDGWEDFFIFNEDGSIQTEKPVFKLRFAADLAADGKKLARNVSLVEPSTGNGSVTYQWTYSDNTTSTGLNPTKSVGANESLTLVVNNGSGPTVVTEASILLCNAGFSITYLGGNQVKFEVAGYNQATSFWNIQWVFSNGTTSTSNPVTKTFTSDGTATLKMIRKLDGQVECQLTQPYFLKCGIKKTKSITQVFNNAGGSSQKWKLDCKIWVNSGQVGCSTKYLKWNGLFWVAANNEGACSDIAGQYKREVMSPYSCNNINASGSKCLGSGIFPTSVSFTISEVNNVFRKTDLPVLLNSGHKIKVNGNWVGLGVNGVPRLVLD